MYRVLWGAAVLRTSLAAELEFYINLQCPVGRGTPDLMLFCISNIHLLWREIKHLLKLQETIEPANVIITHTHTHLAHLIQFLKHSWWPRRVCNLINSRAFKLYFFLWLNSFGQNSFNQDHPHEIKNSTCLCSSSVFCSLSLFPSRISILLSSTLYNYIIWTKLPFRNHPPVHFSNRS